MDHLCYFCLSCACHAFASVHCCLVSPAGKGLTSWLSFVMINCALLTFPCGIFGQVWYWIVSIPDICPPFLLCHLSIWYLGLVWYMIVSIPNLCLFPYLNFSEARKGEYDQKMPPLHSAD